MPGARQGPTSVMALALLLFGIYLPSWAFFEYLGRAERSRSAAEGVVSVEPRAVGSEWQLTYVTLLPREGASETLYLLLPMLAGFGHFAAGFSCLFRWPMGWYLGLFLAGVVGLLQLTVGLLGGLMAGRAAGILGSPAFWAPILCAGWVFWHTRDQTMSEFGLYMDS